MKSAAAFPIAIALFILAVVPVGARDSRLTVPPIHPSDVHVFSEYGLTYYPPRLPSRLTVNGSSFLPVAIFLHAAVGIFPVKRKRPGKGDFWGYGREIMEEILTSVRAAGLLSRPNTNVYVTLLGTDENVRLAEQTLRDFNATAGNVHVLVRGRDLYVVELPTIHALHLFSLQCDPRCG